MFWKKNGSSAIVYTGEAVVYLNERTIIYPQSPPCSFKEESESLILTDGSCTEQRLDIISGHLKSKGISFEELVFTRLARR